MKSVWITTDTANDLERFYHDNMDLINKEGYEDFTQWVNGMIKETFFGFWVKYARGHKQSQE